MKRSLIAVLACIPAIAAADDEPTPPAPPAETPAPDPAAPMPAAGADMPSPETLASKIDELTARNDELTDEMSDVRKQLTIEQHKNAAMRDEIKAMRWILRFVTLYADVGAFAVGGDGSGIRADIGHVYYPKYAGKVAGQWVILGDPLSTAINSIGEPSDTSMSREIPVDTVNSAGRPSFIVNTIGLSIGKYVGHGISVASLAQLLPRPDANILDIPLAEIAYRTSIGDATFRLSAGKVDSVLGIEYRAQDAPVRLGVTPSLICRYTCGRVLGMRAQMTRGPLSIYATLTNGDNFQQIFERDRELKANTIPTASGHVQWLLPVGQGLELGVSGAVGPQDGQPEIGIWQWHYGFDVKLNDLHGFDVAAEYVQGLQQGKTVSMTACDAAPCLTYKGAYLLVDRRVTPWVTPYVRVDYRDAVHIHGADFVYESHTIRATVGAHLEMTSRIIAKIEYTLNRELGNIPEFADDIVTSSLVVATD